MPASPSFGRMVALAAKADESYALRQFCYARVRFAHNIHVSLGMIDDLHRGFESAFGIPLAVAPMPGDLIQIFPGQLLWGSAISQQEPLLTQSDIDAFLKRIQGRLFSDRLLGTRCQQPRVLLRAR